MDKEVLKEQIEEAFFSLAKSRSLNNVIAYLEGEGAVLAYLAHYPRGVMPSVISDKLGLSRARITNILNSLRQKGMVELENDPNDRRRILAIINEKGMLCIMEKANAKECIYEMLYEKLGEEKLCAFLDLLRGVGEIFEKADREGEINEKNSNYK